MPAARDISENGAELVHCVYRVSELPVVASLFEGVRGVYDKVKHAPVPLVGRTLDAAEATAKYAAAQAYPFAVKLERPIGYFDSLACRGLDALEDNMPIVKRAPDQIMADARAYLTEKAQAPGNMVTRVKNAGAAKVDAATEYSRTKVIEAAKLIYAQKALQGLDSIITTVDTYVDKYIPAEQPENEETEGFESHDENWDPALVSFAHAAALSSKLRRRIYKLTLAKAHVAQKKCADALDQVQPAGFVDYVRAQLTSGSYALVEATNTIWKETASITPGRAAQAVTTGMNVIEARTALAARTLLQYLQGNFKAEQGAGEKEKQI